MPAIAKGTEYYDDLSNLKASTYIQLYGFAKTDNNYFIPLLDSDEEKSENNIYISIENNKLRIVTGKFRQILKGFVILEYAKTTN